MKKTSKRIKNNVWTKISKIEENQKKLISEFNTWKKNKKQKQ